MKNLGENWQEFATRCEFLFLRHDGVYKGVLEGRNALVSRFTGRKRIVPSGKNNTFCFKCFKIM